MRMRGNTPNGTKMHFPYPRSRTRIHTSIEILEGRPLSVFKPTAQRQEESGKIFSVRLPKKISKSQVSDTLMEFIAVGK